MGAHSTRMFTRTRALNILKEALADPSLTNKVIEAMMDSILDEQLYNAIVCSDYLATDDYEGYSEYHREKQ